MFFEQIRTRRSIRKFTNQPVETEKIDYLMEAALRAPSSRDFKPWRFIVVDQPVLLEKLAGAKPHGASFLKGAPLGIVVCGDSSASDVWVEDTAIAATFIHLAAHSLGLGSCWIQIRKRDHSPEITADDFVKDLLNIPQTFMVASIIAIGYPDETKQGHPKQSLAYDKVFFNQFGKTSL
jgi:nitroreductase